MLAPIPIIDAGYLIRVASHRSGSNRYGKGSFAGIQSHTAVRPSSPATVAVSRFDGEIKSPIRICNPTSMEKPISSTFTRYDVPVA